MTICSGARSKHYGYTVTYNSESHLSVLLQCWGSVWPIVLPFCIANMALMGLLEWLNIGEYIDLEITTKGHSFMTLLVAFLIVSRVSISLGRYNEARGYLGTMYMQHRELIQTMMVYTKDYQDPSAKEWRINVAYRSMILLRSVMAMLDFYTTGIPTWDIVEISDEERADIKSRLYLNNVEGSDYTSIAQRWAHGVVGVVRGEAEESMRVPIMMAYRLRCAIHDQRKELNTHQLTAGQENTLLKSVDSFMNGFYGLRKFKTTPAPFPLIQMSRTFLFFYVFTLPFALLSDSSTWYTHLVTIFVVTYGFMGLETVAIELDDPFGDDENDLDNLGMAFTAFEDTYMAFLDVDGPDSVDELRAKMKDAKERPPLPTEKSWLRRTTV